MGVVGGESDLGICVHFHYNVTVFSTSGTL